MKRIALYFNTSTDYLLDIPDKHTKDSWEKELLRIFRSLSEEQKEIFIEWGKVFIKINSAEKEKLKLS